MTSEIQTFQDYVTRQNRIYEEIREGGAKLKLEGAKPNQDILNGFDSYLIALRHSLDVNERVESLSKRIGSQVPSIVYSKENCHTTISGYLILPPGSESEERILSVLRVIVQEAIGGISSVNINFDRWLYSQDSVIAAGQPNREVFLLSRKIVELGAREGIELKLPKMAHITTARFTKEGKSKELDEVIRLIENEPPLGTSSEMLIAVGYAVISSEGFCFDIDWRSAI